MRWLPRRVLFTPAALEEAHGRAIHDRVEAMGLDIEHLPGNRLTGLRGEDERATYRLAKSTLAVVVAPPSKLRLSPIPPSADWQFAVAEGCPAHCQYCYLAGSLSGPPVVRAYANLDAILAATRTHQDRSRSAATPTRWASSTSPAHWRRASPPSPPATTPPCAG